MRAIFGLGNPGSEYDGTRHNVGFLVVDLMARRLNVPFQGGKGDYLIAKSRFRNNDLLLVKPLTYMNNVGLAVADLIRRHNLHLSEFIPICDDFQLPLGKLRIRPKGSDGGHNGLYSIIYHLASDEFPRIRCGIGSDKIPKDKSQMARFVLSVFEKEELSIVDDMVNRAADAALVWVSEGLQAAMNRFNK